MDPKFREFLAGELDAIREQGLFKEEWPILGEQGPEIRVEGRQEPVLNFCANNYLGLSSHPELLKAAHRALDEWGFGMSSVRFICGTQALHLELEKRIAAFLGMEDAILYAACFDANGGVFEPLLGADDAIVTDQLNHASIIDGVRLCKAKRFVYANADMADLEAKLAEAQACRFRLIVTDGVFSMDGTVAPLPRDLRPGREAPRHADGGRQPRHRLHGEDRPRHVGAPRRRRPGGPHHHHLRQGPRGALGGCTAGLEGGRSACCASAAGPTSSRTRSRRPWSGPRCARSSC